MSIHILIADDHSVLRAGLHALLNAELDLEVVGEASDGHEALRLASNPGAVAYNLSTGRGNSILEVVAAFERACGKPIPYQVVARWPGDLPISYASPSKANRELNWFAQRGIDDMCADVWRWQSGNPNSYE